MTWVPIFLCNQAPKFDEWAEADMGKKGGGFAIIRRVKFLSFPFTFGYEDQRHTIEALGQKFRPRDDSLQSFMKTDRARAL